MARNDGKPDLTPHAWTIVGSGLFWAWIDSLFMGSLFPEGSLLSVFVLLAVSLLGALAGLVLWIISKRLRRILLSPKLFSAASIAGCLSCIALGASACFGLAFALACGVVLGAFYLLFSVVNWGVAYCLHRGDAAVACIAASFALAVVIDLLIVAIDPVVRVAFLAAIPLASLVARRKVRIPGYDELSAEFPLSNDARGKVSPGARSIDERLFRMFGITPVALGSLLLMMLCFGYMQYIMSSGAISAQLGNWHVPAVTVMQIARGVAAVLLLVVAMCAPKRTDLVFKAGLLVAVAGFLTMPFFSTAHLAWLSGAMVMAGYTFFDALIWVLVVRACCTRACDPISVILAMRQVANGIGVSCGMVLGMVLPGCFPEEMSFHPDAIVAGYAATIAAMLVVGSREVWSLFEASSRRVASHDDAEKPEPTQLRLKILGEKWGLTPREQEVFAYVAAGRSQPWISETLCIAEGTAKTHIRHIYQKAGVSSKQALIDQVFQSESSEKA